MRIVTYWQYGNKRYDYRGAMYPKEMDPDELKPIIMGRVGEFRNGLTNPDRAIRNRWISTLSIVIKSFIKWSSLIGDVNSPNFTSRITRTDDLFVLGNVKFFGKILDIQDVKDHFRAYLKNFEYPKKEIITEIFAELPKYRLSENEKKTIVELTELLLHKY